MAKGEERKGPVFYYEWQDQIDCIPPELQLDVFWGILNYDRYGERLDTSNIDKSQRGLVSALMDKFYFEIDKQRANWETRAGRPAKYPLEVFTPLFAQGLTNKEIAEKVGCSERTVLRKRKDYDMLFGND